MIMCMTLVLLLGVAAHEWGGAVGARIRIHEHTCVFASSLNNSDCIQAGSMLREKSAETSTADCRQYCCDEVRFRGRL
jgi:hypothetical protein